MGAAVAGLGSAISGGTLTLPALGIGGSLGCLEGMGVEYIEQEMSEEDANNAFTALFGRDFLVIGLRWAARVLP